MRKKKDDEEEVQSDTSRSLLGVLTSCLNPGRRSNWCPRRMSVNEHMCTYIYIYIVCLFVCLFV